jgi:hypothetical protein
VKTFVIRTLGVVLFLATLGAAQDIIPLYPGTVPGSTQENYPEKEYFSKIWNTEVVANVFGRQIEPTQIHPTIAPLHLLICARVGTIVWIPTHNREAGWLVGTGRETASARLRFREPWSQEECVLACRAAKSICNPGVAHFSSRIS